MQLASMCAQRKVRSAHVCLTKASPRACFAFAFLPWLWQVRRFSTVDPKNVTSLLTLENINKRGRLSVTGQVAFGSALLNSSCDLHVRSKLQSNLQLRSANSGASAVLQSDKLCSLALVNLEPLGSNTTVRLSPPRQRIVLA